MNTFIKKTSLSDIVTWSPPEVPPAVVHHLFSWTSGSHIDPAVSSTLAGVTSPFIPVRKAKHPNTLIFTHTCNLLACCILITMTIKKKKPLDSLTLAFSWASIDTEQQHAKREWIKNKDGEFVSRGRARPNLSKTSLSRWADKAPPPSLPPARVRQAFHREVGVQPYSKGHNHEWESVVWSFHIRGHEKGWSRSEKMWLNRRGRWAGRPGGNQVGNVESTVTKVYPTTRKIKKKREASNTREMLRTKEARKLRLGPTQKNYERKMNKAWGAGRERSQLFGLQREKEFPWPVTN